MNYQERYEEAFSTPDKKQDFFYNILDEDNFDVALRDNTILQIHQPNRQIGEIGKKSN